MNDQRIALVVYIKTSPELLWDALTNPEITQAYWFDTRIESDWQVGSKILYVRHGEITDEHTVVSVDRPHRLVHTFHPVFGEFKDESASRVSLSLDRCGEVVRLTLEHDNFPPQSKVHPACSQGWPMILSSLKTLLETGDPLPEWRADA